MAILRLMMQRIQTIVSRKIAQKHVSRNIRCTDKRHVVIDKIVKRRQMFDNAIQHTRSDVWNSLLTASVFAVHC